MAFVFEIENYKYFCHCYILCQWMSRYFQYEQLPVLCADYPNSMYGGLMRGDGAGSASLSVPADRLLPVHPDVRLKRLPFYDMIAELLKPSTLSEF